MNKKITESLKFLNSEHKRLMIKQKNKSISASEKETLKKIQFFLGIKK